MRASAQNHASRYNFQSSRYHLIIKRYLLSIWANNAALVKMAWLIFLLLNRSSIKREGNEYLS